MLELSLHYAIGAHIMLYIVDVGLLCNLLNLAELGFVLANLGRIGLAGMTSLPSIPARSPKTCRLLARMELILILLELLIERDEEPGRRTVRNRLRLALDTASARIFSIFLLCSSYLIHFLHEVRFLFLAEKKAKIVVLFLLLLGEVKLFFISRGIVKAEVLGDSALACARDHGQGSAQLSIEILFQ